MMKNHTPRGLVLLAALLFFPLQLAVAQSTDETAVYYIHSVRYQIQGITTAYALQRAMDLHGGELIQGKEALKVFVQDKLQLLLNQRVLEDATIDYWLLDPDADGRVPVDLTVSVKDTWNLIALPYFKYDSNTGLELSVKARDFNFLGTMEPLKLDLGYTIDPDTLNSGSLGRGTFFMDLESKTPFVMARHDANFIFNHYLAVSNQFGFEYLNTTGLTIDFPYRGTVFTVGAFQGISVNEEELYQYKPLYGDRYPGYWYLSNWLTAAWTIPTGFRLGNIGMVQYVPSLEFRYNYKFDGDIGDERHGPTTTVAQSLDVGRFDWVGNYRRGFLGHLEVSNEYNLFFGSWDNAITGFAILYHPVSDFFGPSFRLIGNYYFGKPDYLAGLPLRGILDKSIVAQYGLYFNADFPFRLIQFVPSQWFKNRKYAFFDFEQQWGPFIDMALLNDPVHGTSFSLNDMFVTGGLEVVTFPLFMRSFYIRISVGLDLRAAISEKTIPQGDHREIYVGLGHHY